MVRFIGVKTAKPLALCKQGANPYAHVLMTKTRKTAPDAPAPSTEITEMNIGKIAKALAGMDEVTKAYFQGLDDDKATAFLEKSIEDQKTEADAAKKAKDEEASRLAGKSAREIELEGRVGTLQDTVKSLEAKNEERDIEAKAATFAGYPGGTEAVVKVLKSCKGLNADQKDVVEQGMRDKIAALKLTTRSVGMGIGDVNLMPASKKLRDEAETRAKAGNKSIAVAMYELSEDPKWADDFAKAREEEAEAREPA